jgi:hypothetical protein
LSPCVYRSIEALGRITALSLIDGVGIHFYGLPTIRPQMSLVDPLLQRLRHLYITPISEVKPRSVLAG